MKNLREACLMMFLSGPSHINIITEKDWSGWLRRALPHDRSIVQTLVSPPASEQLMLKHEVPMMVLSFESYPRHQIPLSMLSLQVGAEPLTKTTRWLLFEI